MSLTNKLNPGRRAALDVLLRASGKSQFASETTARLLDKKRLSARDKAFAHLLCRGVISTRGTLDELIDRVLKNPADIKPNVRMALRVSTYELYFLDKAAHAVVSQGVELVRSVEPKAARLVNFALHRLSEQVEDFPFGDVQTDVAACARQYGFPIWLTEWLWREMGVERSQRFMGASNTPSPLYIHGNIAKQPDSALISSFSELGYHLRPFDQEMGNRRIPESRVGMLRVDETESAGDREVIALMNVGACLVSDASAQYIAALGLPLPERYERSAQEHRALRLLEIGAGRGTKSVLLQELSLRLFGRPLHLVSVDASGKKLRQIPERLADFGLRGTKTFAGDARELTSFITERDFDAVFIDAPCSGMGTLRRHPEIRWRLTSGSIDELVGIQRAILAEAAACVSLGGVLTYATCSVLTEENEQVIQWFLNTDAGRHFRIYPLTDAAALKRGEHPELWFKPPLTSGSPDAHFACTLIRVE